MNAITPTDPADALRIAIARMGGQMALAKALRELGHPIGQPAISAWVQRGQVPAHRAITLERLTGVPRSALRPDLYPPEKPQEPRS